MAKRRRITTDETPPAKTRGSGAGRRRSDAVPGHRRMQPPRQTATVAVLIVLIVAAVLVAPHLLTGDDGEGDAPGLYDTLEFSGAAAKASVRWQCDQGPRTPNSTAHRRVAAHIFGTMSDLGYRVEWQNFTGWYGRWERTPFANVVATLEHPDPLAPVVVLVAHYDTRPFSDRDSRKQPVDESDPVYNDPIFGANDGASGVAVLLELARVMADEELPYELRFLFVDGEDSGPTIDDMFYGSKYHVRELTQEERDRIAHVIVVDMVGDRDLSIPREQNSQGSDPGLMDLIWENAALLGVEAFEDRQGDNIIDDHSAFIYYHIPAIDLIDFDYPNATVNYWHTQEDTPDKVSAASLEAVGRVLEYTLKHLDP